ncbi:Fibronectin type III domain-containing protein [Eubacterium uniforme]|uniref:Fibronectin type III domain-containing protein n=1 Tax=Eubacterium uniforme TaxID=39495 RepID=A0A1T4VKW5_9FIRM|nr:fibronectin type III domain-containing protein [Eubacterium uniforme]SKA65557.1 Fibronectin type III domain-containing protein [Eubacterium uniforme]
MFKKTLATLMVATMMATSFDGVGFLDGIEVSAATILPDSTITSIPVLSSEHNLIRYMDNSDTGEYKPVITETFVDDWEQDGGVHKYTAPEDGTIMWYTVSRDGCIEGTFYSDFELTNGLGGYYGASNRQECKKIDVIKGKSYYFRQHRWNGQKPVEGVTYMGFTPKSKNTVRMSVTPKYDETNNVTVKEFSSYDDYYKNIESTLTSELYISESDQIYSETKSFTVKKSGWLFIYAAHKLSHIDMELFSDKDLNINIGDFSSRINNDTEGIGKIWLDAGTYYYRGERWNGYEEESFYSPLKTYLGFVPAEKYITVSNPVLSADKRSATVKFTTPNGGNVRVQEGAYAPYKISDDFWDVQNRANMVQDNTFVAKIDRYYTARVEDSKSGNSFMVIFTTEGIGGISDEQAAANNTGKTTTAVKKLGKAKIKKAKNLKGRKIKVTLKKVANATGYEVQYATNKKFKKAKTKKIKKLTVTLKKLKKNKKYFIRVRAINKTTKGAWSKVKKVKVKK